MNGTVDAGTQSTNSFQFGELHAMGKFHETKFVYCFLGFPGCGKTTQMRILGEALGIKQYHVGKFLRTDPGLLERTMQDRRQGKLARGVDEAFLDYVAAQVQALPGPLRFPFFLDGFPRSMAQVAALIDKARHEDWRLKIVWLELTPERELFESLSRQIKRATGYVTDSHVHQFIGKILRCQYDDCSAMRLLQRVLPKEDIIQVNALQSIEKVTQDVRLGLGLDWRAMDWDWPVLQAVDHVCRNLSTIAYVIGGGVTRPFWNNNFGPMQRSIDVDLFTLYKEDAIVIERSLIEDYKSLARWSAHGIEALPGRLDAMERRRMRWKECKLAGLETLPETTEEDFAQMKKKILLRLTNMPLLFRQSAVRLWRGSLELLLLKNVEGDLRRGILRYSYEDDELDQIKFAAKEGLGRSRKYLNEYPGLILLGPLKEQYEREFKVDWRHQSPPTDWDAIIRETRRVLGSAVEVPVLSGAMQALLAQESVQAAVRSVVTFLEVTPPLSQSPPRPAVSSLPEPLEQVRKLSLRSEFDPTFRPSRLELDLMESYISPPVGYTGWMEFVFKEASDGTFREWMLNQRRSRQPKGGRDALLAAVFDYSLFPHRHAQAGAQLPFHCGWSVAQHTLESLLQLHTSDVLDFSLSPFIASQLVLALRMAVLFHAMGKILDPATIDYPRLSSRIWKDSLRNFSWISSDVAGLVEWLLEHQCKFSEVLAIIDALFSTPRSNRERLIFSADHDLFRTSSIPLKLERNVLSFLLKQLWLAHVGSVASLRWLLPLADEIEGIFKLVQI